MHVCVVLCVYSMCVCVCVRLCICVCVHACIHACVHVYKIRITVSNDDIRVRAAVNPDSRKASTYECVTND